MLIQLGFCILDWEVPILGVTIDGDPESALPCGPLFQVVLRELITNAVEHNDQETPKVEITVTETTKPNELGAKIEVADNGPRLPRGEWEIINSGEETQLEHTIGVGLWIVYWSVTVLGGRVTLSANEPRGNVLTVELPMTSQSESAW